MAPMLLAEGGRGPEEPTCQGRLVIRTSQFPTYVVLSQGSLSQVMEKKVAQ